MKHIGKIAVIGSGVMGSGIAAQIANSGHDVLLFDMKSNDSGNPNALPLSAIDKMKAAHPSPFMIPENAQHITACNLSDDFDTLGECEWIIEVIIEDLSIKRDLYQKLEKVRRDDCVISSNTSTIPLAELIEGRSESFQKHFIITHFFNPPRFMTLLEWVEGKKTDQNATAHIQEFCRACLGKIIVPCNDTPGFIANRLGVYWLDTALREALRLGIDVETADAILSRPVGIPKTGVFGLLDLIGIDLMPKLADSMLAHLSKDDDYARQYNEIPLITGMIENGYTGRKGKGGFYRIFKDESGGKIKQTLSLKHAEFDVSHYSSESKADITDALSASKKGLRALFECDDIAARYAWSVMSKTLRYAAKLVPEITDNIYDIDRAMKAGYNWKFGPFEMIDAIGTDWFCEMLAADGNEIPPLLKTLPEKRLYKQESAQNYRYSSDGKYHAIKRETGVLILDDIRLSSKAVISNQSCNIWDIGDGVLCFDALTKMNTMDEDIFQTLRDTADMIAESGGKYRGLVAYNEGAAFSAGANLGIALQLIHEQNFAALERFIKAGQITYMKLKFAPFPFVCAPKGLALGGGCEILLHADHICAHAETYTGLVETGVGLIPAWGGCKEMILRYTEAHHGDARKATDAAFALIGKAVMSSSAADARSKCYLAPEDTIIMNHELLLQSAKDKVLSLSERYRPPAHNKDIKVLGSHGKDALDDSVKDMHEKGHATDYDLTVLGHLSTVLTGGNKTTISEQELLDLEIEEFMKLLHNQGTIDRIDHMLKTGKPLRN